MRTNIIILVFIFALEGLGKINAQSESSVGITFSPNISWSNSAFIITGFANPASEQIAITPGIGYSFGLNAGVKISKSLSIQVELQYFKRKYHSQFQPLDLDNLNADYAPFNITYSFNTIQIPVNFKYLLMKKLYLVLGYSFEYILNEKMLKDYYEDQEKYTNVFRINQLSSGSINAGIVFQSTLSKNYYLSYGVGLNLFLPTAALFQNTIRNEKSILSANFFISINRNNLF